MLTIPELKAVAAGLEVPLAGRGVGGRDAILACFRRVTAPPGQLLPVRPSTTTWHATPAPFSGSEPTTSCWETRD